MDQRVTASAGAVGSAARRPAWVLLAALYLFTLVAVAGYGVFALRPENLPDSDLARRVFTVSFEAFARLHIGLAAVALLALLVARLGRRWVAPFFAVCGIAFLAEHVGTGYGVPFGGYSYSGLLGPKLGGRVPALIPMSWFLMALPAWVLAQRALPTPSARVARVALAGLWLVAWDLALDPAMSFLTPYWSWATQGPYYGMPWVNLLGWYGTGLLIMTALEATSARVGWESLDARWLAAYYGAIVLMPLGMLAAAGAWAAVGVTLSALGGLSVASVALGARAEARHCRAVPIGAVEA